MNLSDEIVKLNELRQNGVLSEAEFQQAKAALIQRSPKTIQPHQPLGSTIDHKSWGLFIHLSQFCGYVVPLAGLILPIILWQIKKDASPEIDQHGRIVANWILTQIILAVIFGLLCFVMIGIPLVIALVVVGIIFPIIGAIKANEGIAWVYPCSFQFF